MDTALNAPRVSVILPVYNAQEFLRESVESVLAQSFRDFELIILNDGSSDGSDGIIRGFRDERIVYRRAEHNRGLIRTLNEGLAMARGEYVARMDADDISLPDRLMRQVQHLDAHPRVAALGTWFWQMRGKSRRLIQTSVGSGRVKAELMFRSALAHPTVMMRRSVLSERGLKYDDNFPHAEDFELWTRLAEIALLDNLPEPLLFYRVHAAQVSSVQRENKNRTRCAILSRQLMRMGVPPDQIRPELHDAIATGRGAGDDGFLEEAERWLIYLGDVNRKTHYCSAQDFRECSHALWAGLCANSGRGWKAWKLYRESGLSVGMHLDAVTRLRMAAKLLIRYRP
jgi:glycosyltransferase involved in cell wall biosynthesis